MPLLRVARRQSQPRGPRREQHFADLLLLRTGRITRTTTCTAHGCDVCVHALKHPCVPFASAPCLPRLLRNLSASDLKRCRWWLCRAEESSRHRVLRLEGCGSKTSTAEGHHGSLAFASAAGASGAALSTLGRCVFIGRIPRGLDVDAVDIRHACLGNMVALG